MDALPTPRPTHAELDGNPALVALQALAASIPSFPAVAYSGGADSTALLLAAAAQWPGQVQAIHIHHGLQDAADDFVRVCSGVCASIGVPLHVARIDASHGSGESPEDAARRARYAALAREAKRLGVRAVLLGQHADDQVETLLLALSRGAGLPGMAGMAATFERDAMKFYRPLLGIAASQLREWLVGRQVAFVDDPTNLDLRYTRNLIRAQLLPAVESAFPRFRETFARSARHAAQARELLREVGEEDLARVGIPPDIQRLQWLSKARRANVLRHWLLHRHQTTPTAAQLDELLLQIAACTTRGHRIHIKVGSGHVSRSDAVLAYV